MAGPRLPGAAFRVAQTSPKSDAAIWGAKLNPPAHLSSAWPSPPPPRRRYPPVTFGTALAMVTLTPYRPSCHVEKSAARHASRNLSPRVVVGDLSGDDFPQGRGEGWSALHWGQPGPRLDLVLRSIGYRGAAIPGLPFDARRGVLPVDAQWRVAAAEGPGRAAVYATGWAGTGAAGVIATTIANAAACARSVADGRGWAARTGWGGGGGSPSGVMRAGEWPACGTNPTTLAGLNQSR